MSESGSIPLQTPVRPATPSRLTEGPVLPLLLRFALPNMVALVAQTLATVAETRYVGRMGAPALAGLALVFPLVMLQGMLSAGAMGSGVSSAISRALGAGRARQAGELAAHALAVGIGAGLIYMGLVLWFARDIFALLGGRGEALELAVQYAQVAFLGSVFLWIVNTAASVLRGRGDMVVPSAVQLGVAIVQVLVAGALGEGWGPLPALGMAGIASGQVIANGIGAVVLLWMAGRGPTPALPWRGLRWRLQPAWDILKVGAVASLSPLQAVLTILILTRLVAQVGAPALAGYGIGTRLEFLLIPVAFAVGVGAVPLVGMAIGAGKVARARHVAWVSAGVAAAMLGVIGLIVAVRPELWVGLFTDDPAVTESAALYFAWAGPCYPLFGVGLCLYFASLGAGKPLGPVLAGTLRLVMVAAGGAMLTWMNTPPWTIFALVAAAMAAYGLATMASVRLTAWGNDPR